MEFFTRFVKHLDQAHPVLPVPDDRAIFVRPLTFMGAIGSKANIRWRLGRSADNLVRCWRAGLFALQNHFLTIYGTRCDSLAIFLSRVLVVGSAGRGRCAIE